MIKLSSPIVSAAWLYENRHAENLIILDGTINKSFNNEQIQIPNARLFDIKGKFSNVSDPFPSTFPSQNQFESEARALGINNASAVVVYDDEGIYSSARVWWLFKAFGFNNIAVLNGGIPVWKKEGFTTESMSQYEGAKGDFIAALHPKYMRFFDEVKEASKAKTHIIIDARASGRFKCQVPEPRAGLRMGTIPNSVNLPFTDLLEDGLLKPKVALEKAFYMLAAKDDAIIFSCGSGITACVLALGATLVGYKNISVYDGSWTEWGSLVNV